ncbi:MAG: hypothetical protein BM564_02575 [Bacteroidetes bacterium MedPE-SWsnd-G2]|nr:MAG: hypothetical protein BM564_02575 [Bacteroidetes bacterium MedPE-SWsnd-G2]
MDISRIISVICIVIGAGLAIYSQDLDADKNYYMIGGIMLVMIGVYRVSRNIPSKHAEDNEQENQE